MPTAYDRPRILAYAAVLVLLVEFGAPYNGLIDVPVTFFLKNRLHLAAHEISLVRVIGAIPIYAAFLIGLARDRFNLLRRGDRGFLILFGLITALAYAALAFAPITRVWLMVGVFGLNFVYLFLAAAMRALISVLGQGGSMTGRLTTVWYVVLAIPLTGTYLAGGWLSEMIEGANSQTAARVLFLVAAAPAVLVGRPLGRIEALAVELVGEHQLPAAAGRGRGGRLRQGWGGGQRRPEETKDQSETLHRAASRRLSLIRTDSGSARRRSSDAAGRRPCPPSG